MARIALVTDVATSHIYATLGLAHRLRRMGHAVEYWGNQVNASLVQSQGLLFQAFDAVWPRFPHEIRLPRPTAAFSQPLAVMRILRARREWLRRLPGAVKQAEAEVETLIDRRRPDLVLFDPFLLAYSPLFLRHDVPVAVLSTKPLATHDPLVPPYTSSVVPSATALGRVTTGLSWIRARAHAAGYELLRRVMQMIGAVSHRDVVTAVARCAGFPLDDELVRRGINRDLHFRSVPEWVLWTREMDLPRARDLPGNIRYIGPCVDLTRREFPIHLDDQILKKRRIVYVAVGTVRAQWQANAEFLMRVVAALADLPHVGVIVSTADERTTRALGRPPANVRVFDFLPQLAILDIAHLAITHAGAGTYRECIAKLVPMLAYPRVYDQLGNSARVVFHGIGLRGSRMRDSVETIRHKAMRILDDEKFRENIARLRDSVRASEDALLRRALAQVVTDATDPARTFSA